MELEKEPDQTAPQTKFLWTTAILHVTMVAMLFLLGRYDDASNPKTAMKHKEELKYNLEAYPLGVDIMMMLFAGFGYLMTFLKRYGLSSLGFTMVITAIIIEFGMIVMGLSRLGPDFTIHIGLIDVVEGGIIAAAVLISFGVVLGKVNPFQLLIMGLIESVFVVLNFYIGYTLLGANDVGGSIFVHTFGAYFGLAVSFCLKRIKTEKSEHLEGSRYTSDMFSLLGTIILWAYWPSFNGILATGDARHRVYINTYISLTSSTITTFIFSGLLGNKLFGTEDIQNATLAGGVMVGATCDMLLQPYGAAVAGTLAGLVSTVGYKSITSKLYEKLKIHDTCGVHNLHGMPGVMAGLLSVVMVLMSSEDSYGPALYKIFPLCAPEEGSHELSRIQQQMPEIKAGQGRALSFQALIQLLALTITIVLAVVVGGVTGLLISFRKMFEPVPDDKLFDDEQFWNLAEDDDAAYPKIKMRRNSHHSRSRSHSVAVPRQENNSNLMKYLSPLDPQVHPIP